MLFRSAHKLTIKALFRLIWQAFIQRLNSENQQSDKANVEGKHLADSIKSFRPALTCQESVPQKAEIVKQEFTTVMELFETF